MTTALPSKEGPHVLLGVTGSVAAVKAPEIAVRLVDEHRAQVKVLLSAGGKNFWEKAADYDKKSWERLQVLLREKSVEVITSDEEWKGWNRLGDSVLHIDLRDWASVFLIAPLSAHTLAKLAKGLCDDTLSCVARAWDLGHGTRPAKPIVLAPAMNTAMWQHPLTAKQLQTVQSFSALGVIRVVEPASKKLACGEIGVGALATVTDILEETRQTW